MGKTPNKPIGIAKFDHETGLTLQVLAGEELERRAIDIRRHACDYRVSSEQQQWFVEHVSLRVRFMDANSTQWHDWLRGHNCDHAAAEEKLRRWVYDWAGDFLDDEVEYKSQHSKDDGVPTPLFT